MNSQIPMLRRKKPGPFFTQKFYLKRGLIPFLAFCLLFGLSLLYAEENNPLTALSKQIMDAKTSQELYAPFESLKEYYFKDNKYSEFVDYLRSLDQKKKGLEPFIDYYIALARYQQLKYLEDKQLWDEYFSQGNNYRDDLTQAGLKAVAGTPPSDPLHVYAQLVLWQFHKDQQDAFEEGSLSDLMTSALDYAAANQDLRPIKQAADKFSVYGEKGKAKELYKIYAQKLISSGKNEEDLANSALAFYKENNVELAENIYDAYIDGISKSSPKEKLASILADIAHSFAYKDQGPSDPSYAEKIFKKMEELAGKDSFDQGLMYLRAFNLEKAKDYPLAKDMYVDLTLRFPQSPHYDEAVFKAGLISAYVLRDINAARGYFEKLTARESGFSPQAISSLYQLGLLSQWENDTAAAKDYYNKLVEIAKDGFPGTTALARERLKEIEEGKPVEYNLKTFLDLSFKKENLSFDMSKLNILLRPYKARMSENVSVSSTAYTAPTGCMQVELQYLWSGDLGKAKPSISQPSFDTSYISAGTKEVNLVVVSPTGTIDRAFDIVDVQ
jgi:hypothetical protein